MVLFDGIDNIYFERTKKYFEEVVESYYNGNYRSAVVLLYSTAISDILFKLNELDTIYNDAQAHSLLEEIKTLTNEESKSKWEFQLVKKMVDKGFVSNIVYSDLQSLYSDRCFSAHPVLNENYELISPSKESTIAHIVNVLNGLLIEPPMFNKNIADRLTDDLKARKDTFLDDDILEKYLYKTYYSKLTDPAKLMLFKSFWKLCFNMPNDQDCIDNLLLNIKALMVLCKYNQGIVKEAKRNDFGFRFATSAECMKALCLFLSQYDVFQFIDENDKLLIENFINDHTAYKFISWFIDESIDTFINRIKVFVNNKSISIILPVFVHDFFYRKLDFIGQNDLYLDVCISMFVNCTDFHQTMNLYSTYIRPNLRKFSIKHFEWLLNEINNNYCIHKCWAFSIDEIMKTFKEKLGSLPDVSNYKNISFPAEYLESTE